MRTNISDILLAPWVTGVITTAIRLQVFSVLSDRELTGEEIARECGTVPDRLKRLLHACVSLGFLKVDNEKFSNSHFSLVYFVEGKRFYIGDFIKLVNDESIEWLRLPDIIRGKHKADEDHPYVRSDYRTFIMAMNNIGHLGEADALRDAVDLSGCKTMVDAGGGSGLYSIALCQKYPELHSTILDVKDALTVAEEMIANQPEKSRITLREGDFIKDPLGKNVDVVLLSDVVYEESIVRMVLQNSWESLAHNGLLVVRGYYADPEKTNPVFGALFAVKALLDEPDLETVTISKLTEVTGKIGFKIIKSDPLTERSFVLLGRKQ
jgi:hypothetical protein